MISRRLANLFSVTVALLALSHCSVLKPSKHVSVEQKLKAGISNQIDTVQKHGYIISFQTQQELARHQSDVRSLGGSTSTVGNSLSLRVNIDLNKLSTLQIPLTADLASNAEIRISLSRSSEHLSNSAFSSSSEQSLQDLLSVRKITGVDSLRKRFPNADGSGVKVAVFDTGIDFGVKGLSETRMNKLEGFYDFTNFGKVTLTKATKSEKGSFVFADSYEIAIPNATNLPQELQAGILDEKIIARQYLAPSVDIDGNGKDNDQFHFLKIDQKIFIDLNQDRNVSDEESEILADFNTTKDFLTIRNDIGSDGALPLSVTIQESTVQFHRVLNGHGTSCAAIISGDGYLNSQLQGLAPNSKLLSYTLDTTGQDVYTIDEFMNMFSHAKSQNVDVISISWGFTSADLESQLFFSRWLDREITSAGIVIATAAGNEGPAITSGYSTAYMPQNGFSVGAMISSLQALNVYGWNGPVEDTVVWYSSVGPSADNRQSPDIISPIISLVRGERNANGGNFYGFSGTSSATPALAGSLASLISVIRNTASLNIDTHLLKVAIQSTSRRLASVENIRQGAGLVNVDQAYDAYLKLYREKHQTEATQKFAYKLDVKTPLTDRPGFGEGIHLSKLDRNGMTIEVSLNEESLNRVDRFAFADAISIHHSEQFISTPDVAVIQASPTKISVRFNEAALVAPGIYTDIIELRSSGGEVLLKQIPVVIEIPSQLSPAKLVQHINIPSFSAFSIKRSVIDLDQKGTIKFNGIIQKEFPSTGDSFGVFVTSKTGERVFDSVAPMSVNGPTVVDLKTEVLLPGRYEVVFFRNISRNSSFGGPVGVFLSMSIDDKAVSAIKDFRISDGSASLLLDIAKIPKVESVVIEAKKRRISTTLIKTADIEKKFAFVGVMQGEFAEGELQIELNHLEIDQSFAKFSQMSLALIDSDTKDVLYRGWVETRTIGRPALTVEVAKASKEFQIFAYPNIVDWDHNPVTEFNFAATIPLSVPTTFKSNSIVKLSNMAKLSFQSSDITDELRDLTFILLDKDNIEIGRY